MISIIVARDLNNGIGNDNKLLCHIPADMKHFKEITENHTVIMGRKTFWSLPNGSLPNRKNIVLTSDAEFFLADNADDKGDLSACDNIQSLIDKYKDSEEEVFVIGGASVYEQFLPYTSKIYLTTIMHMFESDTFFEFDTSKWKHSNKLSTIVNTDNIVISFDTFVKI